MGVQIWKGGIALFGGLTFGLAAAIFVMRRRGGDFWKYADAAAIALPAAQAIGRWGNYFNQELFGTPTSLPWGLQIDPDNRPAAYLDAETFHPTFLYEMLWNIGIIVLLLWLERHRKLRRGVLFGLYAVLYAVGRFLLELIRTDSPYRYLGPEPQRLVLAGGDPGRQRPAHLAPAAEAGAGGGDGGGGSRGSRHRGCRQ